MTFAERVLEFNDKLSQESIDLPVGFKIINPYKGDQKEQVKKITTAFYHKYYGDTRTRVLILGSSPARRGSAKMGVPFEDAEYLQKEAGIYIGDYYVNKSSSTFLFDVITKYGGREKFYNDFYMNFVCPLGIVRTNPRGNEVNCNYYENIRLQEALYSFIVSTLRSQIDFGIDTSVCYCIGSGENYRFLSKVNNEFNLFSVIEPLEHPRFITQYNSTRRDIFMEKYINALCNHRNQ